MIESNINELIVFLTETVKQGVMFTQQNIPVWVNEILQYGIFQAWFSIIVEVSIMLVGVIILFILKRGYKARDIKDKQMYGNNSVFELTEWVGGLFTLIITIVIMFVFFLMILVDIHTLIQISKAPMLYLLETISKLI